ncbi:hypothetical protein [Streptomonospora wellingtoniae]|uniref:Uncharacterized protein n=1 Tax=Streptomonospora wellingtoniae TaxID=3075544 RepID=A0ABU2KRM3_9ACTN|nr:hypothetical protein [Streptomonospora sp. DSM 45055]MDT0301914.1 hypothetical protein [Streptomonospora sp. DSM 45055]
MVRTAAGGGAPRASGGDAGPGARAPRPVRAAAAVWAGAVAAGATEAAVFVAGAAADGAPWPDLLPGLAVRAAVYAAVLAVVAEFHRGRRWARTALALGLGIAGTLSLVYEPLSWALAGGAAEGLPPPTPEFTAVVVLRTLHIAAVPVALVLMYRPAATAYLRGRGWAPRSATGGASAQSP